MSAAGRRLPVESLSSSNKQGSAFDPEADVCISEVNANRRGAYS